MTKGQKIRDVLFPFVYAILILLVSEMIVLLIAGLAGGYADPDEITAKMRFVPLLSSAGFYICSLIFMRRMFLSDEARFGRDHNGWPLWKAAAAVITSAAAGDAVSCLIGGSGISQIFQGYSAAFTASFDGQNVILLVAVTCVLGPVAEEVIFRGIIFRRARAYLGPVGGAIVSALLFGLYHANVVQFIYAAAAGMLFALWYHESGSLKICAAAHAAMNLWAVLLSRGFGISSLDPATWSPALPVAEGIVAAAGIFCILRKK